MNWWDSIIATVNQGDILETPGTIKGARRRNFPIVSKNNSVIKIDTGSPIKLDKPCFDAVEIAFEQNPALWLRVASLHDKPLPDSADKLIREATGSDLARGNYVCAILEHCGLVNYSRKGNWKTIVLPSTEATI